MIRVATVRLPYFRCGSLRASSAWTELDMDALGDEAIDILVKHTGTILRVHPDDRTDLKDYGLKLVNGRVFLSEESSEEGEAPPRRRRRKK